MHKACKNLPYRKWADLTNKLTFQYLPYRKLPYIKKSKDYLETTMQFFNTYKNKNQIIKDKLSEQKEYGT